MEPYGLSPEDLKRNLVRAGLFLVAFELVKALVVRPIKLFYQDTTFGKGMPFTTYERDVLARDKDVFQASLLYLRDHMQAISADDLAAIQELRKHRNRIAHELTKILPTMDNSYGNALLAKSRESLFRLSNYRTKMEVGADLEFARLGIDWDTVTGEDLVLLDKIIEQCS